MSVAEATAFCWQGDLTLSYSIQDAAGNTSEGQIRIPVPNAPPVTAADTATLVSGETVVIDVLANDIDPEGGALTLVGAKADSGTAEITSKNTVSYTAPSQFSGSDTITYEVRDPAGDTTLGTVNVTVEAANPPPTTREDVANATAGLPVSIDVLVNDTDPEGETLSLVSARATSGSVVIETDNTLTYTAPTGFSGTDEIAYRIQDEAGHIVDGRAVVTVEPQKISIEGTTIGDFAIRAGAGAFELSIIEPADMAATYTVSTEDLSLGPVVLEPVQIGEGSKPGDVIETTSGIWAGYESHGALAITQQWYRGGTAIPGATGSSYKITEADVTAGLSLYQTAANTAGSETVQKTALAPAPTPSFTENPVEFRSARLIRNANLASSDDQSVFYFLSFTPNSTGRQGILRQTRVDHGVDIWDGRFRFRVPGTTASRAVSAGVRTNILAIAMPDGANTKLQLWSRLGKEAGWSLDHTRFGTGPVRMTFGTFSVGCDPVVTGHHLNATVYRIACWSGVVPDTSNPDVWGHFLKADGTLEDPTVSRAQYGTPLVDLYGNAKEYVTGVNNGTAGNFNIAEGAFTDV